MIAHQLGGQTLATIAQSQGVSTRYRWRLLRLFQGHHSMSNMIHNTITNVIVVSSAQVLVVLRACAKRDQLPLSARAALNDIMKIWSALDGVMHYRRRVNACCDSPRIIPVVGVPAWMDFDCPPVRYRMA
jgi:hypothetical protein